MLSLLKKRLIANSEYYITKTTLSINEGQKKVLSDLFKERNRVILEIFTINNEI